MLRNRSRRRLTGGKRKSKRKSRKHELKRESILCKVGNTHSKKIDVRGNQEKTRARAVEKANVADREGKTQVEKIEDVVENEANSHFVRRSALTKGTVVETGNGKAKITSRPGQEGIVNAVRVE